MQMQTPKQAALQAIALLPDGSDTEAIIYQLYVLENIRKGQRDAQQGRTITTEQLLKDMQAW